MEEFFDTSVTPFPEQPGDALVRRVASLVWDATTIAAVRSATVEILKARGLSDSEASGEARSRIDRLQAFQQRMSELDRTVIFGSSRDSALSDLSVEVLNGFVQRSVEIGDSILHGGASTGIMGAVDRAYHAAKKSLQGSKSILAHSPLMFSVADEQAISEVASILATPEFRGPAIPVLAMRTDSLFMHPWRVKGFLLFQGGVGSLEEFVRYFLNLQLNAKTLTRFSGTSSADIPPMIVVDDWLEYDDPDTGEHVAEWMYEGQYRTLRGMAFGKGRDENGKWLGTINPNLLDKLIMVRPMPGESPYPHVHHFDGAQQAVEFIYQQLRSV